ncbi:MAG: BrnT family toxin, partial [Candidatus Promineofilum sp.]|nr:BrnT family toxin [Promineifilum sp.]
MEPPKKLPSFEWDLPKEQANVEKHGVSFSAAQYAFADQKRIILEDITHSTAEE